MGSKRRANRLSRTSWLRSQGRLEQASAFGRVCREQPVRIVGCDRCAHLVKSPALLLVKRDVRSASILKDGRVVFNIAGNKYRIVVWINYPYRVVYIRFIGTHRQYDAIDAQSI